MSDKMDNVADIMSELTPEEQRLLTQVIKRLEADIFHNVLKRLSVWTGVVVALFVIGGLVNMNACSSNIETSTAQKLINDPELRDKVIGKAQEQIKLYDNLAEELQKQNAQAVTTLTSDIEQIHKMVKRINDVLSNRLPSRGEDATSGGNRNQ
jgi:predicted PurR-regulated permease PerM